MIRVVDRGINLGLGGIEEIRRAQVIADDCSGLVRAVRDGLVHSGEIEVDLIDVGSEKRRHSALGVRANFYGTFPIREGDGRNQVAGRVTTANRTDGLVVLTGSNASVEPLLREKGVGTWDDVGRERSGRRRNKIHRGDC